MRQAFITGTVAAAALVGTATAQAGTEPTSRPVLVPHGCTTTYAGRAAATPVTPGANGVSTYAHAQGANAVWYFRCAV